MLKKANIIWILVLVTALTVQWLANKYNVFDGMLYGNEETAETTVEDHQDDSGEGVAGVDYYYTCGMHPNIREEEPGICPICNMNLVKKTVSGAGSAGQVAIDPVTVQNMGVRIEEVQRRILTKNIRAYGKIEYDETLVASVSVKVEGWAEKLYVDYVGKTVRKGDPLLEIYSPELVSTQEEYLQALKYNETYKETSALTAKDHSQKLLESTRKRLKLWDISAEQLEDLEQNGEVKRELTLFSPASGIVIHKEIDEGDRILPMRHIFRVADVSRVWIHADIYENDMAWIKEGQIAKLTVPSLPGREFEGKLSFIYPYLEKGTRTVRTRFEFDNRDGALKPEMYANIMISAGSEEPQLTVPLSSVLLTGERSVVIVDLGEGKFEPREVKIGIESDDQYAILEGLEEGERVVTSAQFLIDSESRLREAQVKMMEPGEHDHSQSDEETGDSDDQTVLYFGEGEMTHHCPMEEDLVFSHSEGSCPRCGMFLSEMDEEDKGKMDGLIEGHEIIRILDSDKVNIDELDEYMSSTELSVIFIGEGEMTHYCPMEEDKVFSSGEGECPRCGMFLKEMNEEQKVKMRALMEDHEVLRIVSPDVIKIEKAGGE